MKKFESFREHYILLARAHYTETAKTMSLETDVDTGETTVLDGLPFAFAAVGVPAPRERRV